MLGERLVLRVDLQVLVVRDDHVARGVPPARRLVDVDTERSRRLRVFGAELRRPKQVPLRHQVGVDVVVDDRAVFVRTGDAVDAETAGGVVVTEAAPQPRGLDEQRDAGRPLELRVARRVHVAYRGVGDVTVDVEGGRTGRPVGRALLAVDRAPREGSAGEAELLRPRLRLVDRPAAPAQVVGGRVRDRV